MQAAPARTRVREVDEDELPLWQQLRLQALADAPYAFCSNLAEWQEASEQRWLQRFRSVPLHLIAERDGHPVGMVAAAAPDEHRSVTMISLWVAPQVRGQHVGDSLVSAVCDWAKAQGAVRVALTVTEENRGALEFYRRLGFTLERTLPGTTKLEMSKQIS